MEDQQQSQEIEKQIPVNTKDAPALKQRTKLSFSALSLLLLINIGVSISSVYLYDKYFAIKIAVIDSDDIRKYIQERRNLFVQGKINSDAFSSSVNKIDDALEKVEKRIIILKEDSVVKNASKIKIAH